MISYLNGLFDKAFIATVTALCGWLGHDYIREGNGFTYCRHCGHVAKGRD